MVRVRSGQVDSQKKYRSSHGSTRFDLGKKIRFGLSMFRAGSGQKILTRFAIFSDYF